MWRAHDDVPYVPVCVATAWKSATDYAATAAFAVAACFCISV